MSLRDRVVVALVVAAAACKSGKKSADPQPAGSDATIAAAPVPDAAPPCVDVKPWGADAERAGIEPVVHHPFHVDSTVPMHKDVTLVMTGEATIIKGWRASYDGSAPQLALMDPDQVTPWIAYDGKKVRITAPAELEGAVWDATTMTDESFGESRLLAFDYAGAASYNRFFTQFEGPREHEPFEPGGTNKAWVRLELLQSADVDGDGTAELVAWANVGEDVDQTNMTGAMALRAPDVVLVVMWADGKIASAPVANLFGPLRLYRVPAALSGGAPMLFAMDGTRLRIVDRALVELEDDTPHDRRSPGADLGHALDEAAGKDAAPAVDAAPPPLTLERANRICLATSPTEPARLRPVE